MRRATLGLTAVLLVVSCEDACWQDDYEFVWRGESVTVYAYGYTEADVCGGSYAEADGHTAMIMSELGIHEGAPYVFRWFSPEFAAELGDAPCDDGAAACASGGEALSPILPDMHELVHAMTHRIDSDGCPDLLNEGLATYFDNFSPPWDLRPTAAYELRDLIETGFELNALHYLRAAHFVSFLAEEHGSQSIVRLCEALPPEPTVTAWDTAVRSVYGLSLEQLLADYESYPECSYLQMQARRWGCSGPPDFTFTAKGEELVVEAGCNDPQATNASSSSVGDALLLRRVYFAENRRVSVSVEAIGPSGIDATIVTQECAPCSKNPDVYVGNSDAGARLYRAGMHEISVFFDKRDQVRLSMYAAY